MMLDEVTGNNRDKHSGGRQSSSGSTCLCWECWERWGGS
jgi:hypothetical protein